ncbi:MAG: TonB family protein [Pseudomonadota bacterium]
MSPTPKTQPALGVAAVCPSLEPSRAAEVPAPAALVEESISPGVAAALSAPGVSGAALVPPLATAPCPEWFDPFGELAGVFIEPEDALGEHNAVLELATLWHDHLLDVRHVAAPATITVGENSRASVVLSSEGLPSDCFPLIRHVAGESYLTCTPQLEGRMLRDGVEQALSAVDGLPDPDHPGCRQIPLTLDSLTTVEQGGITLQLRFVARPAALRSHPWQGINYSWLNLFVVSLFVHVGFFATAALYPYDTTSLEESLFAQPNRFAQFVLNPPQDRSSPLLTRLMQEQRSASSARHVGDEGQAGRRDAPDTGKRMASKGPRPTNEQTVQRALSQMFGARGGGLGVGSVLGSDLGGELVSALGGVTGARVGDSGGFEGLGARGHGPGGNGTSTDTFGVGSIRTAGHGDGNLDYGDGGGGLRPRTQRDIEVSQGVQVLSGALDKELIRQVIADNIAQIRYCYTHELAANPGLHGKVVVRFIIAGTGRVSSASVAESSLDSTAVESCIARKVHGWRFPKPRGGGIVVVNYPFLFKQSG